MCQVDIGKIISGHQTTNTASLDRKPSGQFACVATADGNINSLPQSSHGILYCPLNFPSRPSHLRWWLLAIEGLLRHPEISFCVMCCPVRRSLFVKMGMLRKACVADLLRNCCVWSVLSESYSAIQRYPKL